MDPILPFVFIAALAADLLFGDPEWLPHPVRWTGRVITLLERVMLRPGLSPLAKRLAGAALCAMVAGGAWLATVLVLYAASLVSVFLLFVLSVYVVWSSISIRSLKREAEGVLRPLVSGDLPGARVRLRRIVGRDTERLDNGGVLKATAETIAESTSDGIVAPIFYLAAGGPLLLLIVGFFGLHGPGVARACLLAGGPGLMVAYKAVNTLDSMVGYRSARYEDFGRYPARLDDLMNYLPSRLTAALMVAASFITGLGWRRPAEVVLRDGRNHPSPNAGLPEAALAGALGLKFGGPMSYAGVVHAKPHIGDDVREPTPEAVGTGIRIMLVTSALVAALCLLALTAEYFLL